MKEKLASNLAMAHGMAALIMLLPFAAGAAGSGAPSLRAGAAAVDISPREFPVNMPGLFNENIADGLHDPLHSRALVLDDGTTTLAMVVVDNLHVGREQADEIKALVTKRCGIAQDKIMISSTHAHSAPPANVTKGRPGEVAYRKILMDGVVESIVRAHAALRPAAIGTAAQPLPDEVRCRRWFLKPGKMPLNPFGKMDQVKMNPPSSPDVLDRPAGPTDPDVTIISVQDVKSGKPLALFANYSLHYVGNIPKAKVSADYFGEFARVMPSRIGAGEDFVAAMFNGTSGDINNSPFLITRPPRQPFEQVCIVAAKVADAAREARAKITSHSADARLGMAQREVVLRRRRPTPEQLEWAKGVLAIKDKAELEKLPHLADAYARRVKALENVEETVKVPLQAIRIGDFAVCTIPFEAFAVIGLDLKRRSPFPRTMVIELANGAYGYLPTPEQHKLGGYETWLGTCGVREDASVVLVNNLLEMLAELKMRG